MKQVRFASVVQQSGKPEVYLLLSDPRHDDAFQKALKANRIMTLQRGGAGGPGSTASKTDYGAVGYVPGPRAQVLLFPRALKIPADAHIVGINYDLLDEERELVQEEPKPKPEPKPKVAPPKSVEKAAAPASKPAARIEAAPDGPKLLAQPQAKTVSKPPLSPKVIPFAKAAPGEGKSETSREVAKIKGEIRKALKALESGKQVPAFNILKKILD